MKKNLTEKQHPFSPVESITWSMVMLYHPNFCNLVQRNHFLRVIAPGTCLPQDTHSVPVRLMSIPTAPLH